VNTHSGILSRRSMRKTARKCGASTRSPDRESRGAKHGRRTREDRGWVRLGDGLVRSRIEPDVIGVWATRVPTGMAILRRDNLYTSSVVALDADTGKLKWHYQFSPHDEFDQTRRRSRSSRYPVGRRPRKAMCGRTATGFFYVLGSYDGAVPLRQAFRPRDLAEGFRRERPSESRARPGGDPAGTLVYPGNQGATNWYTRRSVRGPGCCMSPAWVITRPFSSAAGNVCRRAKYFGAGRRATGRAGSRTANNNLRTERGGLTAPSSRFDR